MKPNPAFNPSRNKQNYLTAKACFNARDIAACVAHYAPEHKINSPSGSPAAPPIEHFFEQTIAAWPDIEIIVAQAMAEDDWVMVAASPARLTPSL